MNCILFGYERLSPVTRWNNQIVHFTFVSILDKTVICRVLVICLLNRLPRLVCDTRSVFKRVQLVWIQFSSGNYHIKSKYSSLFHYLPIYPSGCRIHRQHLCRGVRFPPNECSGYDTKQSDGEVPVMQSTPSLPSLPGPLWPGLVAPDKVLSMSQIELNCVLTLTWITWNRTISTIKQRTYAKLNCLKWNCLAFNCVWTKTILKLNWIIRIRTVWLNWIAWNRNIFDN